MNAYVFECSGNTYIDCIQKGVFGSNKPWPLQVAKGDFCLLHHYEVETLFALWRAETYGGKNIVAKAWGGRFPFQAKIALATPDIIEVPRQVIDDFVVNPSTARLDNVIEGERAKSLIQALSELTEIAESE